MSALTKHLRQNEKDGCKTVVFSQFTSFLDLIGESLDYECISFTRLDGTQSQAQREKVLSAFSKSDNGSASVLLISLRAGGVGLNLTCANRVVMMVSVFLCTDFSRLKLIFVSGSMVELFYRGTSN